MDHCAIKSCPTHTIMGSLNNKDLVFGNKRNKPWLLFLVDQSAARLNVKCAASMQRYRLIKSGLVKPITLFRLLHPVAILNVGAS